MEIELTRGFFAVIDDRDIPVVEGRRWVAVTNESGKAYAGYYEGETLVLLHRLLLNADPSVEVDHRDGCGLNNRRDNIRICTHAQNMQNRAPRPNKTGISGVYEECAADGTPKFMGRVQANGKVKRKMHESAQAAGEWVARTRLELHGEFVRRPPSP